MKIEETILDLISQNDVHGKINQAYLKVGICNLVLDSTEDISRLLNACFEQLIDFSEAVVITGKNEVFTSEQASSIINKFRETISELTTIRKALYKSGMGGEL